MGLIILLGALGTFVPVVIAVVAIYNASKGVRSSGFGGGFGGLDLDSLYRQMAAAIRASQNTGLPGALPPQLLNQWSQAQSQMRWMDQMSRERMDLRRGELMSMAAQAGIDVKL